LAKGDYLLGVDTGFSKSVVTVSDSSGRVLATVRGAGVMLFGPPTPDQVAVVGELISRVCDTAGIERDRLGHVGAGMCGVDLPKDWEDQHRVLCSGLGLDRETTVLVNDAIVALWGATGAGRATIVQQGSAFTSAYRGTMGEEELFDPFDHARLVDLRKEALARVVRMLDGRAVRTPFADRFLEHFGVTNIEGLYELLAEPRGIGWRLLSTIVGVVSTAWVEGDPIATELVEALATDLAVTVRAMAVRIGEGPFEAAFGGGVIERLPSSFLALVSRELTGLCPQASTVGIALPPEQGALVMAGHAAGMDPGELFAALVTESRSGDLARTANQ
jgi:N-acetylglucosamine kinase-like BadF-type ATPase